MTSSREIFIKGKGGQEIFLRIWDDVINPRGVVQIFHGMAEHSGRYENFAKFLNDRDIIVFADDHRGHGETATKDGQLGYLGDDGFNSVVEDEYIITNYIKEIYKDIPVYIFAHSFGSFIGQEYIIRYSSEIDGIILSGSAKNDGADVKTGIFVSTMQSKFISDRKAAKFIDNFAFGGFNKNIDNPKTKVAWLTRDEEEQSKYINDKLCAFVPTINFYRNLFLGIHELYKVDRLKNINKKLPILVLSGKRDPVGKNGESVKRLYKQYKNLEIENVDIKLFEECRHELLNEINKDEVMEFIYKWFKDIQTIADEEKVSYSKK